MNALCDVVLSVLEPADVLEIRSWEAYPKEFEELDYALREGGWLDEYVKKLNTDIFAVRCEGELIGFSILHDNEYGTEFRIALKHDKLGLGLGRKIALATIQKAFTCKEKSSIYLIVRVNNTRAKALYEKLGFTLKERYIQTVNAKEVSFFKMELQRSDFYLT